MVPGYVRLLLQQPISPACALLLRASKGSLLDSPVVPYKIRSMPGA
jgi:hypothetical protein